MSTFYTIYSVELDGRAYVGATCLPLAERLALHRCVPTRQAVSGAYALLHGGGTVSVLETGTYENVDHRDARELHWISQKRAEGLELTNVRTPGNWRRFASNEAYMRHRIECECCGRVVSRRNFAVHRRSKVCMASHAQTHDHVDTPGTVELENDTVMTEATEDAADTLVAMEE